MIEEIYNEKKLILGINKVKKFIIFDLKYAT